jgi:excisionase family DNA binding protein
MADKGMSVSEAARAMGVRVDEIYRLLRSGRLRAEKVLGKWVIYSTKIMPSGRANGAR